MFKNAAPWGQGGALGPRFVIVLLILFFSLVFIFQNLAAVEIQFLFWKVTVSRFFLLTGSIFAGAVAGFLIGWEVFGKRQGGGAGRGPGGV